MRCFPFRQILLFTVVYFAYGGTYLLRMPFGVIKDELLNIYDISPKSVGYLDLSFLLPYALVSLKIGQKIEDFGPSRVLFCGLLVSALSTCMLPYCGSYAAFLVFVFIGGSAQALCWPASCSLISSTFETSKSFVFGLFGTCCFIGGIAGKCLAVYLRSSSSWAMTFLVPAAFVIIISICVLIFSKFSKTDFSKGTDTEDDELVVVSSAKQSLSTWQTFLLPGVFEVSLAFFFNKSIRYMFMFWLPMYMNKALNYSPIESGYYSLSFDIGGILGSCLIGYVTDFCLKGKIILACIISTLGSTVVFVLFSVFSGQGWGAQIVLLVCAGSFNGGSDILLCGPIALLLGKRYEKLMGSSFTGFVNGMGSLGTVLEGPIVAYVSQVFGWSSVILLIILYSFIGSFFAVKAHFSMKH